uniref:Uncharacterized protein n=1 Tax=Sphaeramia orbicularis TaxID=375764 RepID=A0A673CFK2_9TELE
MNVRVTHLIEQLLLLSSLCHLLACTPSPCRGSAHLGRHSITEEMTRVDCWQRP